MRPSKLDPWPRGEPPAPAQCGEETRASVLASYGLDALEDDPELSRITQFAAQLCDTPVALISLVEAERQRFLTKVGIEERETPRPTSFCAYAMLEPVPMVVPDARLDARFEDNPLVTGHPNIRFYGGAPLISHEGTPLGSLCVIDTVPRNDGLTPVQIEGLQVMAEAVMRRLRYRRTVLDEKNAANQRASEMRKLADWLPDVVWSSNADGGIDFMSSRWERMTGSPPPKTPEEWRNFIHEEDRDSAIEVWRASEEKPEGFQDEYRLRKPDGSYRWTLARALPVKNRKGEITRWYGTLTDVDDAHRRLLERELVSQELSHRIKNIFAVISGLIAIKARENPGSGEFAKDLSATLMALSRAHRYVTDEGEKKDETLLDLLGALLKPYTSASGDRLTIAGVDMTLRSRSATPLALVFHELATNSAKYGALSVADGRIEVRCARKGNDIEIVWSEHDGPKVATPDSTGFGSRLVELTVSSQLQGTLERSFPPGGMVATLTVPETAL
ncbi:MAG: PAS domain-containing protein [Parerythrobacter sp.]